MDNKLTPEEFHTFVKTFLVDRYFPDNIHIPGLGVRVSIKSYTQFEEDLYKAYFENGSKGILSFMEKVRNNPTINFAYNKQKTMVYNHLDTLGIKDETEKQEYVSNIIDEVTQGKVPEIRKNGE